MTDVILELHKRSEITESGLIWYSEKQVANDCNSRTEYEDADGK